MSFALEAGEVLCLLGPNGGGKTTLFRTLLGLLPPHGGAHRLRRSTTSHAVARSAIARRVGYVPQAHGYFAFTVREVVLMGRTAHSGCSRAWPRDREVAERVPRVARHRASRRPAGTPRSSGGERQLALIARALAQEPQLLVMDEPTASLDFGNQVRVLRAHPALAASGISILFSTHDPDHAFLCARRALLLAEGRVLEIGAPRAVIRADTLERMYGVSVKVIDLGGGGHTCLPAIGR